MIARNDGMPERDPDNSWNISYSMYFQFANTKQYVYHGVDAFNSNQPTDISDIVYLNINDSTLIKKIIDIPDNPESLNKFQKWTWRFDNGNVLFTIYGTMESQDLALNDGTITALATGVKVQQSQVDFSTLPNLREPSMNLSWLTRSQSRQPLKMIFQLAILPGATQAGVDLFRA